MGILDSITPEYLLRLRIVTYTVLICFSFFIFIGSAVMKDNYGGCPLYADGVDDPGPDSNCNYAIAISVMFQFIYLLARMGLFILVACGTMQADSIFFSDKFELVYMVTDILAWFFTFISACILSAGRNDACDECNKVGDWHGANNAAQAGAWISTFVWLAVSVCGFICALRGGKIPGFGGSNSTYNSSGGSGPRNDAPPHGGQYPSQSYQDPLGF